MFSNNRVRGSYALRSAAVGSAALMVTVVSARTTFLVDGDVAPSGTGLSWASPRKFLREALTQASQTQGPHEIWVKGDDDADGIVYYPDNGGSDNVRTETFTLLENVKVYGGFAGGEAEAWQRKPALYKTVLSGDLAHDDNPADPFSATLTDDNAYHVVTADAVDVTAVLDGFTIRGGNSNGTASNQDRGAAVLCTGATEAKVRDCIMEFNSANALGGAAYCGDQTAPRFAKCTFRPNRSLENGGAAATYKSTALFASCTFQANNAGAGYEGGGMYIIKDLATSGEPVQIVNCFLVQNGSAGTASGGAISVHDPAEMHFCTFVDNDASSLGGAVYNDPGEAILITGSILWANSAEGGAQILNADGSTLTVTWSDVQGGQAGIDGGGTLTWQDSINTDPLFVDAANGNYRLLCASPCIDVACTTVPIDAADVDNESNVTEPTPDRDTYHRQYSPLPLTSVLDIGAFECDSISPCIGDCASLPNGPYNVVNTTDLNAVLAGWGTAGPGDVS
jgi:hypothetical protein